ncbi:MAG TPA: hypothetical protein PKY88_07575 [Anaerohalosphaeraceae bacterium]|nr:hypothetical protein [Anaerohalosphaeraceae bacterium]
MSKTFLYCFMAAVLWAGICSESAKAAVTAVVAPGEDIVLYSYDHMEEVTGVRIHNPVTTAFGFRVEIEGVTAGAAPVEPGFQLIDETLALRLSVQNEMTGERLRELPARAKARIRLGYDRSRIRAKGLRPQNLTLMRLVRKDQARRMWRSCGRVLSRKAITAIRRMGSPVFELGYYGNDAANEYVWAVMDVPGTYALGIPEPASLLLAAGGAGLLAIRRR